MNESLKNWQKQIKNKGMNKKENEHSNIPRSKAPKLLKNVNLAQEQRKRVHKRVGFWKCCLP
jgi:hypothetical protein